MRLVVLLLAATIHLPAQVSVAVNDDGITTLSYNGQTFKGDVGTVFYSASWSDGASQSSFTASSKVSSNSPLVYFQRVYNTGANYQFTYRVEFTTPASDTLKIQVLVTNNDPTNSLSRFNVRLLPFSLPSTNSQCGSGLHFKQSSYSQPGLLGDNVASRLTGAFGTFAWWRGEAAKPTFLSTLCPSTAAGNFETLLYNYYSLNNQFFEEAIAPGATASYSFYFRWSLTVDDIGAIADAGYSLYRTAYPSLQNWPDRRPIAAIFMADDPAKRTAANPRGWFRDNTVDVVPLTAGKQTTFNALCITKANSWVSGLNSRSIRPQGVILWDLEGQEFQHALTYIGNPPLISTISPEMEGAVDGMIAVIRNAGYRIGLTIRPQRILTGTSLPATCTATPSSEVFIKTDATYPLRGYYCSATNTWTQGGADTPGHQYDLPTNDEQIAELRSKIQYAVNRWNASIFYVDSSVVYGGNAESSYIFRTLQAEFPSVLLIPESAVTEGGGSGSQYRNLSIGQPDATISRNIYPSAFGSVNISDGSFGNFTTYATRLTNGSARGDVAIPRGFCCPEDTTDYKPLYDAAASLNATVAMTDRGQARTFQSSPGTTFTYPVTARVYFADTSNNLAASTTYCTRRATDSCYLNGTLQSTATLDLSTTPYYQLRYYDFAGNLVSNPGSYGIIQ